MKIGVVFPGQGCQWVGMGKELSSQFAEARAVFDAADDALGEKLSRLCFEGPEEALRLTANTQPAVLAVSIAAQAVFAARTPAPVCAAGHSLGEYSALVAAGALPLAAALRAVRERGRFMQEAVPRGEGAMAAVLGLAAEAVKQICDRVAQGRVLAPANYNAPGQTVIAGHADAVERATSAMQQAGAKRVIRLEVSAPFHCALMEPVKPRLAEVLRGISFARPRYPVVTNVEAKPIATCAPRSANATAQARPIPRDPPVTNTTFRLKSINRPPPGAPCLSWRHPPPRAPRCPCKCA